MLTDSHCHLASHRFLTDEIHGLIGRAQTAGVLRMVTLATSLEDLPANLTIADNESVFCGIGIHPCDVHHAPDDAVEQLSAFTTDPRVCVIGETGLDYYHPAPDGWDEATFRARQHRMLHQHFELAMATGLNVVIHTRDQKGHASFEDALRIYRDYHTSVRAVFHCFSGAWESAKHVLDLGGMVSFGGVATFKNARRVIETLGHCPPGSFMLETDAPYLAPEPFRGQRNEPAYVRSIAEHIASVRGETLETLALHTEQAADGFFRFRPHTN